MEDIAFAKNRTNGLSTAENWNFHHERHGRGNKFDEEEKMLGGQRKVGQYMNETENNAVDEWSLKLKGWRV